MQVAERFPPIEEIVSKLALASLEMQQAALRRIEAARGSAFAAEVKALLAKQAKAQAQSQPLAQSQSQPLRRLPKVIAEPERSPLARAIVDAYVAAKAKVAPEPEPEPPPPPEPEPVPDAARAEPEVQLPAVIPPPTAEAAAVATPWIEPDIIWMNDRHAVISDLGGKCVVMGYVPSAIAPGTKELGFQTFNSFRERYSNQYIAVPHGRDIRNEPLAKVWLAHKHRRQYEGLALEPKGGAVLEGNLLNLWHGWGVQPQKGSWKLFQRHVAEVLADGNAAFADYILRSAAWKFQNPGATPGVALVLRGGKGSGKGAWGYIMMKIFGRHGLHIFSSEHLCGKHNAHLQNKLFLFSDEATWAGDHQAERVLKGMITEKVLMIEPKGINAFQWPNHLGIYMSANAKWVVPASHDERRFAVNNVSERWKQNPDYFRPLFDEINNGGAAAMLHDLLQLDLDGWHPAENIPQTKALLEQKLQGLTGLEQWYVYMLSIGLHPTGDAKNPRRVTSNKLLADVRAYSPRNRFITAEELASFLKEMGFSSKSDGKLRGWIFPQLGEGRDAWTARAGGTWEWDAPDITEWGEKPGLLDQ